MIYSNGSVMDLQNTVLHQKDYKSGIVPFENLTAPDASGLEVCVRCNAFFFMKLTGL